MQRHNALQRQKKSWRAGQDLTPVLMATIFSSDQNP
jgi:hypothetical protein